MNVPPAAWPLIWVGVVIFMLPAVATGIKLQRVPFMMVEYVALFMVVMLVMAMRSGGASPLERVNLCSTPSNLQGCAGHGYVSQPIDAAHDLPMPTLDGQRPDGTMPTPVGEAKPGGPP